MNIPPTFRFLFRVSVLAMFAMLMLTACDDTKPKTAEKPKSKPLEMPCKGGTFVLRHSYPQCQADGLWHIVEDDYYKCPPEGKLTGFRVTDLNTKAKCSDPTPSPIGTLYRIGMINKDSICNYTGELVVPECRDNKWVNITYSRYVCYIYQGEKVVDSILYAEKKLFSVDSTNVPCDSMPPIPKMK